MGTLLEKTLMLMKRSQRQKTLPEISKDTGLPFYWLRKFASGDISDPSVNKVQILYEYLSGTPLFP